MSDILEGTVKWFNNTKGFGFISSSDGKDIFVHYSNIEGEGEGFKSLQEGDQVEFDVQETDKGLQAVKVKLKRD